MRKSILLLCSLLLFFLSSNSVAAPQSKKKSKEELSIESAQLNSNLNSKINKKETVFLTKVKQFEYKKDVSMNDIVDIGYSHNGKFLYFLTDKGLESYYDTLWLKNINKELDYKRIYPRNNGFYALSKDSSQVIFNSYFAFNPEEVSIPRMDSFSEVSIGYNHTHVYGLDKDRNVIYHLNLDGYTWEESRMINIEGEILSIETHIDSENILAVATTEGIFLSHDYGNHFVLVVPNVIVNDLFFSINSQLFISSYDNESFLSILNINDLRHSYLNIPKLSQKEKIVSVVHNFINTSELVFTTSLNNAYITKDKGSHWSIFIEKGKSVQIKNKSKFE